MVSRVVRGMTGSPISGGDQVSTSALMLLGTASHVGKSLLTAGLGRIFSNEGLRVAPFKAQNMSLNSAATPDGREIGRAQALQAEACRAVPRAEMNPILIKPASDTAAQVIVLGRVWGQVTAADYHQKRVKELLPVVLESYHALAAEHDLMLLEGAGSPAEINLRAHDIVNMRMAHAADASCLLVGDIDRGGVFASLLGTVELLTPEDKARIRGFIINKFRGDVSLLRPGVETIEQRLRIPCAGVIPFLRDVGLEEEDSVSLEDRPTVKFTWPMEKTGDRSLRVGVVAYPHMANFTDFDALAMEPSVDRSFVREAAEAARADVLILPGTKQTIDDFLWLTDRGLAECVTRFPGPVVGICGGFQMLGRRIDDPSGVESAGVARSARGLGMLPISTVMHSEKTVRRVAGLARCLGEPSFTGYEIHMGDTVYENAAAPFANLVREGDIDQRADGAMDASGRIWGTYVHGIFDDDAFRHKFVDWARDLCGLPQASIHSSVAADRQARIERWAEHVKQSLDMPLIRSWICSRKQIRTKVVP